MSTPRGSSRCSFCCVHASIIAFERPLYSPQCFWHCEMRRPGKSSEMVRTHNTHTLTLAHTHTFQRHSSLLALNYIFTPCVWRMATLCNLHAKHWCDCRTTRFRMCVCVCCRHCVRTVAHRRRTAAVFAGAPRWRRITNWYELTQSIAALSRPRSRTQPRILSRERERFDRTDQPTVFN